MVTTISTVVDALVKIVTLFRLDGNHNFYCCRLFGGELRAYGLDGNHNFYCCRSMAIKAHFMGLDGNHNFYCCRFVTLACFFGESRW